MPVPSYHPPRSERFWLTLGAFLVLAMVIVGMMPL